MISAHAAALPLVVSATASSPLQRGLGEHPVRAAARAPGQRRHQEREPRAQVREGHHAAEREHVGRAGERAARVAAPGERGREQRTHAGARAARRLQDAQREGRAAQRMEGRRREVEREPRAAARHRDRHLRQRRTQESWPRAQVDEGIGDVPPEAARRSLRARRRTHPRQRRDETGARHERSGVEQDGERWTERRQRTAQRHPAHVGEAPGRGDERVRREQLLIVDDVPQRGRLRWRNDRRHRAPCDQQELHRPQPILERRDRHSHGEQRLRKRGEEKERAAIEAVREHARDGRRQGAGQRVRREHARERQRTVPARSREHADRDEGQPVTDERDRDSSEEPGEDGPPEEQGDHRRSLLRGGQAIGLRSRRLARRQPVVARSVRGAPRAACLSSQRPVRPRR